MAEHAALEVFYGGWEEYQRELAKAIAGLTDAQLELRAAPGLRTVGEQVAHIVAVRAGWLHFDLGEGGPEFGPIAHWDDPGAPSRSVVELAGGLEETWSFLRSCLERWSPTDLTEAVMFEGPPGETVTKPRGWVVWHLLEHDLHHGGELGVLLGMHGLPAPKI